MAGNGVVERLRGCGAAVIGVLRSKRTFTVANGLAEGITMSMRHASNEYRDGRVEEPVQRALSDLLRPGCVFFDVGANVGFFTLLAAKLVSGDATLIAFEARSDIATSMLDNLRRNEVDAQVWAVAVGESSGVASLYVADHPGGSTIEATKAFDTRRVEHVPQVSIDELVESGRLPIPDLVKLDVEGAEVAVVRGMARTLSLGRTTVVYEVDAPSSLAVESSYADIADALLSLGCGSTRLESSYSDSEWHVIHAVARPSR